MVMEPEPVLSTSLEDRAVVPLVRLRVTEPPEVFLTSMVLPEKVQLEKVYEPAVSISMARSQLVKVILEMVMAPGRTKAPATSRSMVWARGTVVTLPDWISART